MNGKYGEGDKTHISRRHGRATGTGVSGASGTLLRPLEEDRNMRAWLGSE
jgi:hypothetical protein